MTLIPCASLRLTASWDREQVVLVRSTDAIRLCRDGGYQEVPSHRALAWVSRLGRREADAVRTFVSGMRLSGTPVVDLDTPSLLAILRDKMRTGELAVIQAGDDMGGDGSDGDVKQRRLVREIETKSQRRLSYRGRQFRLIVDASLGRLPDRDSYEVVRREDAVLVLRGLAGQAGSDGSPLGKLLIEAAGLLTQDWRAPQNPDGLILLRRIIVQQAHKIDEGPALTPSQLKQIGKSDWIEVDVVDQDGEPYPTRYKLTLVDQSIQEGALDADGFLGVHEIESGTCKLTVGETRVPAGGAEAAAQAAPVPESEDAGTPAAAPQVPSPELLTQAAPPAEDTEPTKLRFKLLDLLGKPAAGATVSLAGTDVTSDGDGMIETEVDAGSDSMRASLPWGDVSLDVGALDATSTADHAWKTRLFNLGFLWDTNAGETDDEMILALQDFQAQFQIEVTGKLDDATKAKLAEVYGC